MSWSEGWRPKLVLSLHSSNEPSELSQWPCNTDVQHHSVVIRVILIVFSGLFGLAVRSALCLGYMH